MGTGTGAGVGGSKAGQAPAGGGLAPMGCIASAPRPACDRLGRRPAVGQARGCLARCPPAQGQPFAQPVPQPVTSPCAAHGHPLRGWLRTLARTCSRAPRAVTVPTPRKPAAAGDGPAAPAAAFSGPWVAWVLRASGALRGRPLVAYAVALLLFGLGLGLRFAVDARLGAGFPFLTFFPVIVLSTFFCGRGPGVLSSVLSVLAAWYWFIAPAGSFRLDGSGALAVLFFVVVCVVDILVIDLMVSALAAQLGLQRQTDALLAQRTVLFQELQHRVANNLMQMRLVLADQERRLAHLPEARGAVGDARRRFDMLSRLHRHLNDPERLSAPIDRMLPGLCSELLQGLGRPDLRLSVQAEPVALDAEGKLNVCLLVMELLTNAAKHAFGAGAGGRAWVSLQRQGDGRMLLTVADDGRGPGAAAATDAATAPAGERLGLRIVQGLCRALQGELQVGERPGGGTAVQVCFRAPGQAAPPVLAKAA